MISGGIERDQRYEMVYLNNCYVQNLKVWKLSIQLCRQTPVQLIFTCSKSTIKTIKKGHRRRTGILLLTLSIFFTRSSSVFIDFEHANVSWQ